VSHPHPELGPPPPIPEGALRVIPLGGLGEVGRNMAVLEHAGKLLIIDCGVLFPEDHQPGVDLILPDFGPIADRLADGPLSTEALASHCGAHRLSLQRLLRSLAAQGVLAEDAEGRFRNTPGSELLRAGMMRDGVLLCGEVTRPAPRSVALGGGAAQVKRRCRRKRQ